MAPRKQEKALNALEAAADALELPQIGELIAGRYRVRENLGKGAVGWVWGVEHEKLGQKFALKFLLPSISKNLEWLDRFREEARITSMLGHENIVFVTEFGTAENYGPFLVMEHLEGESLADILEKQGTLPLQQILRFAVSISGALSAVAELGIVHCDLTPNNLYLSRNEVQPTWKILDFGIANLVTETVKTDSIFGTPRYMAPEQAIGLKLDPRADQFSLGVILYEMLTGQTPWKLNSWADATPESRERYKVAAPSRVSDNSPESLDDAILRSISIRRQDRFPSTDDFIEAILENVEVDFEPRLDPAETYQPHILISDPSRQSLQIGVEMNPTESKPRVVVTFMNADRLRREYRRHLIAGRLYLAAYTEFDEGTPVGVDIVFGPKSTRVKLAGVITDKDKKGFALSIDPLFRKSLNQFLKEHRLGFGFLQQDVLLPIQHGSSDAPLSVGEALILTKISGESLSLSSLRAQCSGLPIDFELCVSMLIERELAHLSQGGMVVSSILEESVAVDENSTEVLSFASEVTEVIPSLKEGTKRLKVEVSPLDVDRVLAKSRVFIDQKNYLGAISVLESITDIVADAKLHIALADLFESFCNDQVSAEMHIARAAELDPTSVELTDDSNAETIEDVPTFHEE